MLTKSNDKDKIFNQLIEENFKNDEKIEFRNDTSYLSVL